MTMHPSLGYVRLLMFMHKVNPHGRVDKAMQLVQPPPRPGDLETFHSTAWEGFHLRVIIHMTSEQRPERIIGSRLTSSR